MPTQSITNDTFCIEELDKTFFHHQTTYRENILWKNEGHPSSTEMLLRLSEDVLVNYKAMPY